MFNKVAFLNMMFVKITLIMVSFPYFWGQVSNKKGHPGHLECIIPFGATQVGRRFCLWLSPPPALGSPSLQPPGEFLCHPQAVFSLWAWEAGPRPACGQLGRPTHFASVQTKLLAAIFILIFYLNP